MDVIMAMASATASAIPVYLAAGANRHPSAADWIALGRGSGGGDGVEDRGSYGHVLAFGSGWNVAVVWGGGGLLQVKDDGRGITALLVGHTESVNAVKFIQTSSGLLLITGSVDKTVRIWQSSDPSGGDATAFKSIQVLEDHDASINCIAAAPGVDIFATGDAGANVKIWKVNVSEHGVAVQMIQSIQLAPRYFPLAVALTPLGGTPNSYVLAVAGTAAIVQLYVADSTYEFKLQATLSGHEGWIRSLSFTYENDSPKSDLLLSSASQDKYIRLWRIHQGKELPVAASAGSDPSLGAFLPGKFLSNKAHRFTAGGEEYSATFEALLLGHEDWIYSATWRPKGRTLQLLSASADNSLAIWEQDSTSGVWMTIARLGEISAQKGSTTATGSAGGFWTGLWSPSGETVACIGRTGSWRIWDHDGREDRWVQSIGIGGHTAAVTGIAWSKRGEYLLSASSDQTTRLHAQWKRERKITWHEMARPQIHGYDLNCLDTLGETQFVSGADEKLLRVFSLPKAVADLLQNVCSITSLHSETLPDAANIPVLGLSNKAIEATSLLETGGSENGDVDPTSVANRSTLELSHPPLEDHLSKHTLFPEIEKLYGHGYEISALAASHDGSVIATACRASSIEHAVIRLFETQGWREVKPPLTAHNLTVTRLRFSPDDQALLSVGRDRQWALFHRRSTPDTPRGLWEPTQSNAKGHTRMILDAAWAPGTTRAFATAGRDKLVKLWGRDETDAQSGFVCHGTITQEAPVTAVDFSPAPMCAAGGSERVYLAAGMETGRLAIYGILLEGLVVVEKFTLEERSSPSRAITQLAWRPTQVTSHDGQTGKGDGGDPDAELAVASEDFSLRIYVLKTLLAAPAAAP